MYCVIGEKVLRCEVKKKEELSSICKVGSSKKEQVISNNRLFKTEEEATSYLQKRKKTEANTNKQIAGAVAKCNEIYTKLFEETGIEVRVIDRQWTISSAEKHVNKLRRTLTDKPETHDKNVSKSFSIAPDKKKPERGFKGKSKKDGHASFKAGEKKAVSSNRSGVKSGNFGKSSGQRRSSK